MARTLTRTGGAAQVVPDTIISRRFEFPYTWNTRVSKATEDQKFPLIGKRGEVGIFDQIELNLELIPDNPRHSVPVVGYGDNQLFTTNRFGTDFPKKGDGPRGTSLWTITSKMTCPSFSLPAGPITEGGSCVAANTGKTGGKRTKGKTYICDSCYSLEGQYIYPNVGTSQAARQAWVLQQLQLDPTGERLGRQLAAGIDDYARHASLRGSGNAMAERKTQEIGIWRNGQIYVPVFVPAFSRVWLEPAYETRFGNTSSTAFFASRRPQEDEVVGFFRIHDSGDFTVGTNPMLWPGYINAWILAAKLLPNVIFWGPTRLWIMPSLNSQLQQAVVEAPNLRIRPSALNVDDTAPTIQQMANGTTVSSAVKGHAFRQTFDDSGQPCHQCPVYLTMTAKSCMGSGCRICWLSPEIPVAYGYH